MPTENIAYACLTRPINLGYSDQPCLIWVNHDLVETRYAYRHFEQESNQISRCLLALGIRKGDVVSLFLPKSPTLISALFGILKLQALSCILFPTLGEEGLSDRLGNSKTRILLTKKRLLRKILAVEKELPDLNFILVTDIDDHQSDQVLSLPKLMAAESTSLDYPHIVDDETPAFLQYTSGSTGKPKGALHVHNSLVDMQSSYAEIMGVRKDERYWCTAEPAWITGLVYGIFAPLSLQIWQVQYAGGYHAKNWLWILQEKNVNVWYTAPTALRMLMQEDERLFTQCDFSSLNRIYSVGEPLNPEIYIWGKRVLKNEIYDTWWQSETGSILIANRPGMPVKPGSMGTPRSGVQVEILDEQYNPVPDGEQGHLCIRRGWNSMFRTYYQNDQAYQDKFFNQAYITGDLAKKDRDGYFWYISRADDVINTGGHLVGPFEIESALLEVEEIADVAVFGASDPILYQKIVAFIVLNHGVEWTKQLELKCRVHVSEAVSSFAIPSDFEQVSKIPKNQSGKILRRVLKSRYEDEDPGDISTMESL